MVYEISHICIIFLSKLIFHFGMVFFLFYNKIGDYHHQDNILITRWLGLK